MFMLNGLTILAAADNPKVTGTITLASQRDSKLARHQYWVRARDITDPVIPIMGCDIPNDVTVTTTTGYCSFPQRHGGGTLIFQSISAGTGGQKAERSGISLTNTTGSFTVTGDGGTCPEPRVEPLRTRLAMASV